MKRGCARKATFRAQCAGNPAAAGATKPDMNTHKTNPGGESARGKAKEKLVDNKDAEAEAEKLHELRDELESEPGVEDTSIRTSPLGRRD
jgi:hypothetical protein